MEEIMKKSYNYNGNKVNFEYIQLEQLLEEEKLQKLLAQEREKVKENDIDMLVLVIFVKRREQTYQYHIMKDCIKEFINDGILSIQREIMPLIEARYKEMKEISEEMKIIVDKLVKLKQTIATMESCTGGQLASEITNVSGASEVLRESYVSYSNEAKIKFGVPKEVIEKYTVYSEKTAQAMAQTVRKLAETEIGIGITGQLGRVDPNNFGCTNNVVWYCISKRDREFQGKLIIVDNLSRREMKHVVVREIVKLLIYIV